MTAYSITAPQSLTGSIKLPTSKSISNRLLILSALSGSNSLPDGLSDSDDTRVLIDALRSDLSSIDIGAAGTSMRFLTAYLATRPGSHVITGSERMKKRPIALLVDALRQLGAKIDYLGDDGCPPLRIEGGNLRGGTLTLPGSVSSQYISALMMIGPLLPGGLTLKLEGNLISVPYIAMTRSLMRTFGAKVEWADGVVTVGQGPYVYRQLSVEADWSAASYWYAMAALRPGSRVRLLGLDRESAQGDSEGAKIAQHLGVSTSFEADGATITSGGGLAQGVFSYDFVNQPDLAQTYVVLCCLMGVHFDFSGLQSLRIKETDRIAALVAECRKIGFVVEAVGDERIRWSGATCSPSGEAISTYKDHRMAMSFAMAALAQGKVVITDPGVVSKSYPGFWDDLKRMGFSIDETL